MMGIRAIELFSLSHQFRICYRTLIRRKSPILASLRGVKVSAGSILDRYRHVGQNRDIASSVGRFDLNCVVSIGECGGV